MPKRIQRKRVKGWRMPEDCVSVTRPGKWGNPFKAEDSPERSLVAVLELYRSYVLRMDYLRRALPELRGKDLACWCAEGQPCHADILIELANAPESEATNDES